MACPHGLEYGGWCGRCIEIKAEVKDYDHVINVNPDTDLAAWPEPDPKAHAAMKARLAELTRAIAPDADQLIEIMGLEGT